MFPTLLAAAGDPDVTQKLLNGCTVAGKTFKVHLDGYNQLPFFKGDTKEGPRKEFVYWNDDGQLVAIRVFDWKAVFLWKALFDEGVFVNVAIHPAVPPSGALLRTSVMATHDPRTLDEAIAAFGQAKEAFEAEHGPLPAPD